MRNILITANKVTLDGLEMGQFQSVLAAIPSATRNHIGLTSGTILVLLNDCILYVTASVL